jgi:hypothetical protein
VGVLDDAIRQHLELKRQRGADPGEVKREEDEALGKVVTTRGTAAAPADDPDVSVEESPPQDQDSTVHQPTAAFDPAEVAEALGEPSAEAETEPEPEVEVETVTEPEPEPAAEIVIEPEPEVEPVAEPQHDEDVESDPAEPDEGPAPPTQDPVAEDAVPEDGSEHDELEDTPGFLEDAPEHDKLWFEQKPPKDFDF